ncbi:helix-turn-helix transcriptional regulator [Bradyrhizobium sp. 141]|uniref:helix-turn-helix domain-containing protein n=1 Tax=Bradyrhizobium sp. 141 TaxID=2782617 RepID=UPI001FFC20FB|nr:helix-turn-helix transcriptional regulator [Bradyrhizobium sp. 141]
MTRRASLTWWQRLCGGPGRVSDLALEAGLDRTYVSQVERGARNCTIIVLARLAKALQTTPDRLLVPQKRTWGQA